MNRAPKTKRAPRCSPANGRCPDCLTPLQEWPVRHNGSGTALADFAIFVELVCPMCEAAKYRRHELACRCADCARGVDKLHRLESVLPAAAAAPQRQTNQ